MSKVGDFFYTFRVDWLKNCCSVSGLKAWFLILKSGRKVYFADCDEIRVHLYRVLTQRLKRCFDARSAEAIRTQVTVEISFFSGLTGFTTGLDGQYVREFRLIIGKEQISSFDFSVSHPVSRHRSPLDQCLTMFFWVLASCRVAGRCQRFVQPPSLYLQDWSDNAGNQSVYIVWQKSEGIVRSRWK